MNPVKLLEVVWPPNDLILTASNWNNFFGGLSVLEETKEKDDVFERFTQLYLQTAPKYRLLLKKVWKPDVDFSQSKQSSDEREARGTVIG